MRKDITTILCGFRRPQRLKEQFEAINSQSVKSQEIMFWKNFHEETANRFPSDVIDKCSSVVSNKNFGVWARFALALNAKTEWVALFDDDTIPGNLFFENVLNCMEKNPGVYGTRGVIFGQSGHYFDNRGTGWEDANPNLTQVDIVGHCWIFNRDWLKAYWAELPPREYMFLAAGEDITLSYAIQKHLNLPTYVPPQPIENKELWGSKFGREYGIGREASSNNWMPKMNEYLQYVRQQGFKLINDRK